MNFKNPLFLTFVLYSIFLGSIFYFRPNIVFNNDSILKKFGTNNSNKSILPLWLAIIVFSIFTYSICLVSNVSK